jgi:hydroxyethylthiazole kinase
MTAPRTDGTGAFPAPSRTLAALRAASPLVHNVTNYVAMDVVANALLAVGASPLMAHALEEVDEIVALAHAVAVNIGTLSPPWVEGMHRAAARARALGKPWVLDPVGVGATRYRTETARALATEHRPTVVRGNASEVLALAGAVLGSAAGGATRGVDSAHGSGEARAAAAALARALACVVAVTGAVDYVTDGARTLAVSNGHPLMARVTALGCTATAVVAACLAVAPAATGGDALVATAHALALMGACGERAAEGAAGPGTLRLRFVDALYALTPPELDAAARVAAADVVA